MPGTSVAQCRYGPDSLEFPAGEGGLVVLWCLGPTTTRVEEEDGLLDSYVTAVGCVFGSPAGLGALAHVLELLVLAAAHCVDEYTHFEESFSSRIVNILNGR